MGQTTIGSATTLPYICIYVCVCVYIYTLGIASAPASTFIELRHTFFHFLIEPLHSLNQRFPFWWYFYSALPRSVLLPLLTLPWGLHCARDKAIRLVVPAFGFVFLYSFLPHKELRFIVYVIPLLNAAASLAYANL